MRFGKSGKANKASGGIRLGSSHKAVRGLRVSHRRASAWTPPYKEEDYAPAPTPKSKRKRRKKKR